MHAGTPFVRRSVEAVRTQPWKNGGGITRELARSASWRVSVADVTSSGPFSVFERQRRHSVVLQGAGLELSGYAGRLSLDRLSCVSYEGGATWQATLRNGPVRVFNVITAEGRASADIRVAPSFDLRREQALCLVVCIGAGLATAGEHAPSLGLRNGECIIFSAGAGPVRLVASGPDARFVVARIQTRSTHRSDKP